MLNYYFNVLFLQEISDRRQSEAKVPTPDYKQFC